ncbi:MAG: AsmA-like C-terminal domain-containing protein [Alphaproteobacteria bacterium]|nr:AsmA-like C-terminal domain-containing protein [Alphaproteobacteria bacterium]
MPRVKKTIKTTFALALHGLAFCGAVVFIGVFLLALRLTQGPLTITELTPAFENVFSSKEHGVFAKIATSALTWDKERHRAMLVLTDVRLQDKLDQRIATVPLITLGLRPMGYFDEARSPWNVVVKDPHLHARIDPAGVFHLGAMGTGSENAVVPPSESEPKDDISTDELLALASDILRSPNTRSAGLGLFANLNIANGGITINDENKQITWNVVMPELSLKRSRGNYAGKAGLTVSKNGMQTAFDFQLNYDAAKRVFTTTGSFDHLNPALFADSIPQLKAFNFVSSPLTGSVTLSVDEEVNVIDGGLNLNLDRGDINIPDLYPKPLPFKSGQIVARYNKKDNILRVEPLRFDFEKMILQGDASIHVGSTPRDMTATFKLSDIPVEQLPQLWPENAGKNARDWILENVHKGRLDEVVVNLGMTVPENDVSAATLKDVHGTIKVSGIEMTVWKPLPNLQKVDGSGPFTANGFDITVTGGEMGEVKLGQSHVVIDGLSAEEQILTLDANLTSPASVLLEILDRPPMGYAKKIGINPKETGGNVDGTLHIAFPLLKDLLFDQIELKADTKITDGAMKNVAGLVDVTKGNIALQVTKEGLAFKGDGVLNDVPSTVDWVERFAASSPTELLSKASIKSNAKAQDIKKFGVDLTMNSAAAFPVDVTYERSVSRSKLAVSGDASAPQLDLPDLFYSKPANSAFNFTTVLEWGGSKPMELSELRVRGKDVTIDGKGSFDASQHLSKLVISPLELGETRGKAEFTRGADGVPSFQLEGDVLDIRHSFDATPVDNKTPPASGKPSAPLAVDIQLKRVLTGAKAQLDDVRIKGRRDEFGWAVLEASAMAKNKTPFNFSIKPTGDYTVLSATSPNFGNILSSLDVTDTMIGGKLAIDGKSEPGDKLRNIFGHIKLDNYRITNMPVLAQLISAISPDGLAAMLGGEGLGFGELNAEYIWSKDTIVIDKANTSSGSLGLTVAGKIDLQNSALELEGQVIPVYFISRILSAIPIVGDILTGGDGQGVFAATYRVEGPIAKAKVSVNPVSVLAPGILRNILFMDKDITKIDGGKKQ